VRLRRASFIILPGVAAVLSVALLGPDLTHCVVGPPAALSLTLRAVLLLSVMLVVNYGLMFLVRASTGHRAQQAPQVLLLVLVLALSGSAYSLLAPAPHVDCKNAAIDLR
jgi:hypothetical protein